MSCRRRLLALLGLSTQPVDEEFQEERASELIRDMARLAEPVPFVFCLDQVESLQRHAEDREGIFALGKLVSTLHDTLHNAAVICCVQTSFIDQIKSSIRGSEQDRMLANQAGLQPLHWDQALEVIAARLQAQTELQAARPAEAGRLWPIDTNKLKPIFEPDGVCVARRVLHRAKEIYDEVAHSAAAPPESLHEYLGRLYQERFAVRPAEDSDFILRDGLPGLLQALGLQPRGPGAARPGNFDLVLEYEGKPVAFALCNQRPGPALVNRLRRIGDNWDSSYGPRLILVRDTRLGIGAGAKASQDRLDQLNHRKAEFISISAEALAALDAVRSLLADAESGDLSHNGETIPRKAVEQWLAANLPAPLGGAGGEAAGQGGGGRGRERAAGVDCVSE